MNVSRETEEALRTYAALLLKWNKRINLIGRTTEADLYTRHIEDSAQLAQHLDIKPNIYADLGSGAGLPGIVLAILTKAPTHLIESDQRKAAFLRHAAQTLSLPITIHAKRIEDVAPLKADLITARALAPLTNLLTLAAPHATPDTTFLFPKGRTAQHELAEARAFWTFHLDQHPSTTDPQGTLLKIRDLKRVETG
ncbi:16S rRNA (guanine(527)-N(7))-methyltransferase RsmG [Aestuariibius sp. 2305UL40-4]|uniref:16S rRNA (guanine(527)-N(7))-methyltransferase RsmG n=1 Tax=Aestuariibius violaceus TaxID=3234132 RepID=UPI00345E80F5